MKNNYGITKEFLVAQMKEYLLSHDRKIPTVRNYADFAGISHSTFYRHFTDINALFEFWGEQIVKKYFVVPESDPFKTPLSETEAWISRYFDLFDTDYVLLKDIRTPLFSLEGALVKQLSQFYTNLLSSSPSQQIRNLSSMIARIIMDSFEDPAFRQHALTYILSYFEAIHLWEDTLYKLSLDISLPKEE